MRMVFVHGINQEDKSSDRILSDWLSYLRHTYSAHGPDPLEKFSRVEAAFYGDRLAELSAGAVGDAAIALGADEISTDFEEFAAEPLLEMALCMGVTKEQVDAQYAVTAVPQGAGPNKKWIKAIAIVIEKISPLHGTLALRVLGQAHAYIRNQFIHDEVNQLVRPVFEDDEPLVVVSHSLGTLVAFSLLREFAKTGGPRQCPLFVTLGSPLGIDSVRKGFKMPRIKPEGVARWVNGADPADFVALRPELTAENFAPDIENISDIANGDESHSIEGYLSDARIAKAIAEAVA